MVLWIHNNPFPDIRKFGRRVVWATCPSTSADKPLGLLIFLILGSEGSSVHDVGFIAICFYEEVFLMQQVLFRACQPVVKRRNIQSTKQNIDIIQRLNRRIN